MTLFKTDVMQETNYRNKFAISQSILKEFRYMAPQAWYQKYIVNKAEEKREDHFDYGSLVDTILFSPNLLKQRFFIADPTNKMPSDAIKLFIDVLYKENCAPVEQMSFAGMGEVRDVPMEDLKEEILNIAKRPDINYGKGTYKDERILKEIFEKGNEYFELRKKVGNKTIISSEDNLHAINQVEMLRNHPRSKEFFVQEPDQTLYFQQEVFLPYVTFDSPSMVLIEAGCDDPLVLYKKGAIDIVQVKHKDRTVREVDFKTSRDAHRNSFIGDIKRYGYGTQHSFYRPLIQSWVDANYPGYEVLPPLNVVIDKSLNEPYIYAYNWEDLEIERVGYDDHRGRREGWETTLERLTWHISNNVWLDKELYENNQIALKLYGN